jgi:hypothetical protein
VAGNCTAARNGRANGRAGTDVPSLRPRGNATGAGGGGSGGAERGGGGGARHRLLADTTQPRRQPSLALPYATFSPCVGACNLTCAAILTKVCKIKA